ncbi:stage V sporulation protein B [Desulforamulus ruminis]|uniref:stage V sporulation protein B n=1 Tax=Desulforamulus ruminis TaxID=1564 RepID=UPI002FD9A9C2
MSRQSFVYGALILLTASFINRIIGFIYQMIMIRLIKPEGIGLFNMVFPVYILMLVLASLGIPVAISKLVAEEIAKKNYRGAHRIFRICLFFLISSSLLLTALLVVGSPLLLKYVFPNPKVYYIFLCLIPGVFLVSICSAFRGYFQGLQQMAPTAITQTLEQLMRVSAGLCIAYFLLPRGIEYAAMGLSLGVVIGELTGCLTMLYFYFKGRSQINRTSGSLPEPFQQSCSRIFNLGIPVTLSRFVSTLLMSADAVIIPQRLQAAGLSLTEATSVFGLLIGVAETLLFTPTMITIALATALIPAISDALALENRQLVRNRTSVAVRITCGVGLPCAVAFFLLPQEMCGVLFGYKEAGKILWVLAIGGPFLYFQQTTTGILQGMGEAMRPFKNLMLASVFKIFGLYYLTSIPKLGILGSCLALNLCYILMALLNYYDLKKLIGYQINLSHDIIKPLLASGGMGLVIWQIKIFLLPYSSLLTLIVSLIAGGFVYLLLLFLLGGIHRKDFLRIKGALGDRFF